MFKKISISAIITLITVAIGYYIILPPMNIYSVSCWLFVGGAFLVFFLFYALTASIINEASGLTRGNNPFTKKDDKLIGVLLIILLILLVIFLIGGLIGTPLISSSKYAATLKVEESVFENEIAESEEITDIALMDSNSAAILGNRTMGSLTDLVSQFEVSETYSQIDYNGVPAKIAPLEYAGFFKWLNNKEDGIPGYVYVDPVNNTSKYVELEKAIQYSPSAKFGKDLTRKLRFEYPTAIFDDCYFEIDNEGTPYWICPVLKRNAGLFGATTVKGCVVLDAATGDSTYYNLDEIPQWVDIVFNGERLEEQYDWYGMYSGGFWNSVFGNKGCKVTTDDFGYKVMNNDVYIYTGVTSVNGDESNIGFLLINSRTSECKYFPVAGAEEYSAMSAAEGEVQNLGYEASFPSLINVCGEPTYIMVLKDDGGLVKQYALVNVKQYNIVACATTQSKVLAKYKELLAEGDIITAIVPEITTKDVTITVSSIDFIAIDGDTIVYIQSTEGKYYKQSFKDNEVLITVKPSDALEITYDVEYNEAEIIPVTAAKKAAITQEPEESPETTPGEIAGETTEETAEQTTEAVPE